MSNSGKYSTITKNDFHVQYKGKNEKITMPTFGRDWQFLKYFEIKKTKYKQNMDLYILATLENFIQNAM